MRGKRTTIVEPSSQNNGRLPFPVALTLGDDLLPLDKYSRNKVKRPLKERQSKFTLQNHSFVIGFVVVKLLVQISVVHRISLRAVSSVRCNAFLSFLFVEENFNDLYERFLERGRSTRFRERKFRNV